MKRNNLGVAILRKICLRDAEMIVSQTATAQEIEGWQAERVTQLKKKEKHGSDQESIKASTTISRTQKEHSSSNAMAPKALTVKSVGGREQPIHETVRETVVVSASPTPTLATTRSEPTPLSATVGRVTSRVARVETGVERRDTSKLAKQRVDIFDSHRTSVLECAYSQFQAMLLLAGFHIPPGT